VFCVSVRHRVVTRVWVKGLDRFRDLERAGETGRKDAALLAAIAGFEALRHPTPHDEKQFSNLFLGLFPHTRADTQRIAAAALARLAHVPESVAVLIADQPASTATPFLSFSETVDAPLLLAVIARHRGAHAQAVARRKLLPPAVVAALLELNDPDIDDLLVSRGLATPGDRQRQKEDALRARLKDMALGRRGTPPAQANAEQKTLLGALLAKQAPRRDPARFAQCLALALRSDSTLTERLMLDLSGTQLATALQSLGIDETHAVAVLEGIFPHLARASQGMRHSQLLMAALDPEECKRKVDSWRRAPRPALQPLTTEAAGRSTLNPPEGQRPPKRRGGLLSHQARQA